MNTLTNARLNKLASWRKTHGDSTDVTLPVLEIEELASRVIAAESVPSTIYVQGLLSQIAHLEGLLSKKPVPSDEANTVQRWVSHIVKGHYEYDVIMRRPSPTGSEVDYEDYADLAGETASLRAQLAELRGQEPVAWIVGSEEIEDFKRGREVTVMRDGDEEELGTIALYARPVPPAAAQQIIVTDEMAMAFHRATTDGDVGSDDVSDIKIGLGAALCNINTPASQPYTVPDYYVVVTTANVWQTFCKTRAEADSIVSKPFRKGYYILEVYARRAAAPQHKGE
ncbi:hypothetical protein PB16LOC_04378 [Pectobacterium versatile]|uniref:hypothetical protein n=1 Tax=Pectobacterium versatile TaxID=2488639 RepID=UPI000F9FE1DD|nr:hypothetical protein [Pectobacterium versatile]RUR87588.1 hypothetical protein PB16LOC_04378 [Pectobacterium versatile]